jgi:phosphohistidine phosphatase
MRLLYLLRHAKSSWDDPAMPDKNRPLAARGWRSTALLAEHVRAQGIAPAVVLCSSARRAVETLDGIKQALEIDVQTSIEDELYGADCEELAHRLHQFPSTMPSIMLIGHNPELQRLAVMLARSGEAGALDRLRDKFPTCALATLEVPTAGWHELGSGSARLVALVTPKDLS